MGGRNCTRAVDIYSFGEPLPMLAVLSHVMLGAEPRMCGAGPCMHPTNGTCTAPFAVAMCQPRVAPQPAVPPIRAGVLLWELITGELGSLIYVRPSSCVARSCHASWPQPTPFTAPIAGERPVRGHLRSPEVPGECPHEAADLMAECGAVDPAARPSAQQCMLRLQAMLVAQQRGGA